MKGRIILSTGATLAILSVGFGVGAADQQRIAQARKEHANAKERAEAAGVPVEVADAGSARKNSSARDQRASGQEVRKLTEDLVDFLHEARLLRESGEQPPSEMHRRYLAMMNRLFSLDLGSIRAVLAGIQGASDLPEEPKQEIASLVIMALTETNPEGALVVFNETKFSEDFHARHLAAAALGNLAKENPFAALDWMRKNDEKHPGIINIEIMTTVIGSTAVADPELAFRLITELCAENPMLGATSIAARCESPEQRDAALRALREAMKNGGKTTMSDAFFRTMAFGMIGEDFRKVTGWIEKNHLTRPEISAFADGLQAQETKSQTGEWLGWVADHVEPAKADETTARLMQEWTRNDYVAAGTWLASAPDNPTKPAAVRAYVEAVAPHEPLTAEQWAVTLRDPAKRRETLQAIHQRWPGDDVEGKAAFAERHAINK